MPIKVNGTLIQDSELSKLFSEEVWKTLDSAAKESLRSYMENLGKAKRKKIELEIKLTEALKYLEELKKRIDTTQEEIAQQILKENIQKQQKVIEETCTALYAKEAETTIEINLSEVSTFGLSECDDKKSGKKQEQKEVKGVTSTAKISSSLGTNQLLDDSKLQENKTKISETQKNSKQFQTTDKQVKLNWAEQILIDENPQGRLKKILQGFLSFFYSQAKIDAIKKRNILSGEPQIKQKETSVSTQGTVITHIEQLTQDEGHKLEIDTVYPTYRRP